MKGRRKRKTARMMGVLLNESRIRLMMPALDGTLEKMRILEEVGDMEKGLEPTTYLFIHGRAEC